MASKSEHQWWSAGPDGTLEPIDGGELRQKLSSGELPARLLVWRAGWADWLHASQVPELTSAIPSSERRFVLRPKFDENMTEPPSPPLEKYARYDAGRPKHTLVGMPAAAASSSPAPPRPRPLLSSRPPPPAARQTSKPPPAPSRTKTKPPPALGARPKSMPPPRPPRANNSAPPPAPVRQQSSPPPAPNALTPTAQVEIEGEAELDSSELVSVDDAPVPEPQPVVPVGTTVPAAEHVTDESDLPTVVLHNSAPTPSPDEALPRFELPSETDHEPFTPPPEAPTVPFNDVPVAPNVPVTEENPDWGVRSALPKISLPKISLQKIKTSLSKISLPKISLQKIKTPLSKISLQKIKTSLSKISLPFDASRFRAMPKRQQLVIGIVGGAAALLLVALILHTLFGRKHAKVSSTAPRLSAAAPVVSAAEKIQPPPVAHAPTASAASQPAVPSSCTLAKRARRIAGAIQVNVPLFSAAAPGSGRVAIGFASSATSAIGGTLDLKSLSWSPEHKRDGPRNVLGVVPLTASGNLHFAVDRNGSPLASAHTVDANPPFLIGAYQGGIARVLGYGDPEAVWPDASADAITEPDVAETRAGFAVTFRRGQDIAVGWLTPDGRRKTELGALSEPDARAGTPHVAVSDRNVLVAFAMKKKDEPHFGVALAEAKLGEVPSRIQSFSVPPGGPGGDAISPDATALPGGRWLLQWTEGTRGAHVVRVQMLTADLAPVGAPIDVSPAGDDSGQGVIVARGGDAAALFLVRKTQGYELWAAGLACQ